MPEERLSVSECQSTLGTYWYLDLRARYLSSVCPDARALPNSMGSTSCFRDFQPASPSVITILQRWGWAVCWGRSLLVRSFAKATARRTHSTLLPSFSRLDSADVWERKINCCFLLTGNRCCVEQFGLP